MINFFISLLNCSSYSKNPTHARDVVLQHVAMEEPQPRVVCHEKETCPLPCIHQISVSFLWQNGSFSLNPKVMSMQVHCVGPSRIIPEFQSDPFSELEVCNSTRRLHHLPVESPYFLKLSCSLLQRNSLSLVTHFTEVTHCSPLHVNRNPSSLLQIQAW